MKIYFNLLVEMYLDYLSQKIDSNCRQFSFHESILNKPSQNACLSNPRISQKNYFAIRHLANRSKGINVLLSNPNLIISVVCLKRFYCVGRFNFVSKLKNFFEGKYEFGLFSSTLVLYD